jgi:hypothetical protein
VLAARKPDVETAGFLQHALFEASCHKPVGPGPLRSPAGP